VWVDNNRSLAFAYYHTNQHSHRPRITTQSNTSLSLLLEYNHHNNNTHQGSRQVVIRVVDRQVLIIFVLGW